MECVGEMAEGGSRASELWWGPDPTSFEEEAYERLNKQQQIRTTAAAIALHRGVEVAGHRGGKGCEWETCLLDAWQGAKRGWEKVLEAPVVCASSAAGGKPSPLHWINPDPFPAAAQEGAGGAGAPLARGRPTQAVLDTIAFLTHEVPPERRDDDFALPPPPPRRPSSSSLDSRAHPRPAKVARTDGGGAAMRERRSSTGTAVPAAVKERIGALAEPTEVEVFISSLPVTAVLPQVHRGSGGGGTSRTTALSAAALGSQPEVLDADSYGNDAFYTVKDSGVMDQAFVEKQTRNKESEKKPAPAPKEDKALLEPNVLCPVRAESGCSVVFGRSEKERLASHLRSVHAVNPGSLDTLVAKSLLERVHCPECDYNDLSDTPVRTLFTHFIVVHKVSQSAAKTRSEKPWKGLGRLAKK